MKLWRTKHVQDDNAQLQKSREESTPSPIPPEKPTNETAPSNEHHISGFKLYGLVVGLSLGLFLMALDTAILATVISLPSTCKRDM
jgi:hypothetical protein